MRLPNGYGSVYKLSGKRRKPYIARKTRGYDDNGKQLYSIIGYYATRQQALQALADYNFNPYDLELGKITFAEIYKKWYADEFNEDTNKSTRRNYEAAYKHCEALHNMKMLDIRPIHMQNILDNLQLSYASVKRVHILFNKIFKWCIQHDCIKKNYAEGLKINVKYDSKPKNAFSTEEIEQLWKAQKIDSLKIVLMLIYSGVRVSELLNLTKEDLHIDEQYFYVRASKTDSGIRIVPIADKVLPFWRYFLEHSKCKYVICTEDGKRMVYDNFRKNYFNNLMISLGMNHTIHETRHTCISQLVQKNANQTVIKKIVGHKSIMNLTEKVYTHIEIQELINTINLI